MDEKLLNITEVAQYFNMTEEAIKELVERGELPAYKIGDSLLRFKKEQIEEYRKKGEFGTRTKEVPSKINQIRNDFKPVYQRPYSWSRNQDRDTEGTISYTAWERLADFLYYNDFYILSFILLALLVIAIFGF